MDQASENVERPDEPRSPGAILAEERERQGLARADIAQRLHMSVSQVESLEAADYARLPRGPFLRGFTRNYARSLGLDPEPIVDLLSQDAPRERLPDIVVPTQNIRFDPMGQRLANPYVKAAGIAAALLVLGFAAMYWWLFVRPQGLAPGAAVRKPSVEAPVDAPAPTAPSPPPAADVMPREQGGAGGQASEALVPAAQASATPAAPAAAIVEAEPPRAAAPGEGTLRLAFRGAAWVEIIDGRGRVLLSRTHPGGSSAEVVGRPPFNLVIGNAPEVTLAYNGRDVDLGPHTRVAVARFMLP